MTGSEQHFRDTIGTERASVLLDALREGGARAQRIAATEGFGEARTEPVVAFDLAIRALDGRFDALPGVNKANSLGQILWVVEDIYAIRVKKLTSGYRTSNHVSDQQAAIAAHLPLGGLPPLVYVTAGIRYSTWTGLPEEYVAVKHVVDRAGRMLVEWVVDLNELAAGGLDAATPILPPAPTGPAAPAVRRKPRPVSGEGAVSQP